MRITTRDDAAATWTARTRRHIGILEKDASRSQSIDCRRRYRTIETAEVRRNVIGYDQNNIGPIGRVQSERKRKSKP